jgi:putative selenium metabolism hydrolase
MDLHSQAQVKLLADTHGADRLVVVLGSPDPESAGIAAETVVIGDPTYAGPLAEAQLGHDDFLGKGTVVLSKVECQTPSLNAVPDGCTIYLDRGLTARESVESARRELESLPSVQGGDATVELLTYQGKAYTGLTVSTDKYFPTWVTPEGHPAVRAAVGAGEQSLARIPEVGRWVFSTNGVSSDGKLGISTIGFGPANEIHAHSVDDQCPVDDLWVAAAWYASFPDRYVAVTGAGAS